MANIQIGGDKVYARVTYTDEAGGFGGWFLQASIDWQHIGSDAKSRIDEMFGTHASVKFEATQVTLAAAVLTNV
jgi:hypothetical protein